MSEFQTFFSDSESTVDIKTITDFSAICRVCLTAPEEDSLQLIWEVYLDDEEQNKQLSLCTLFKKYCNIEILQTDDKPHKICNKCISQFVQSYCLFEKVNWSNAMLDKAIEAIKSENVFTIGSDNELDCDKNEYIALKSISNDYVESDGSNDNCFTSSNVSDLEIIDENEDTESDLSRKEVEEEWLINDNKVNPKEESVIEMVAVDESIIDTVIKTECEDPIDIEYRYTLDSINCKICGIELLDVNSAVDHYECHATDLNENKCILCEPAIFFVQRNQLLFHISLHWEDSIKCVPCCTYFRDENSYLKHQTICTNRNDLEMLVETPKEECTETVEISKIFNTQQQLQLQSHDVPSQDGTFTCQLCNEALGNFDAVIEHYENKHINDLQCILCLKRYNKSVPLYHLGLHSQESNLCKQCVRFFRSKDELKEHIDSYDHDKLSPCKICGKSFARLKRKARYRKNQHMISHRKIKQFSCKICSKTFLYEASLYRHAQVHLGRKFLCATCGNTYTAKFSLDCHVKAAHEVKNNVLKTKYRTTANEPNISLQCEYCGDMFLNRTSYGRHIRRHVQFNKHKCKYCSFHATTKDGLKSHKDNNHNKYTCSRCGKNFAYESELKLHSKKYTMDKSDQKHRCDVCGKAAQSARQLEVHYRIHTGEKPHKCEMCGSAFRQLAHLKVHMYQHTGKMPFRCDVCDKGFPFHTLKLSHMRTHTGERPFVCSYCGNAYYDRITMNKHQKKKHPGFPLEKAPRTEYQISVIK